ncbi:MAG: hypothetical protein JOZ72_19965 [Alphaproteobacteria bacterium]|nr:hypothetical protein [Alphaproteobacteria bacterium]
MKPTRRAKPLARAKSDEFNSFVGQQPPATGELPLTHITDGLGFRGILQTGELRPEHCQVFDEPLLYFFYGRPAYRVNSQRLSSAIDAYAPVCLILRPKSLVVPKRIFPFDSGAFNGDRFAEAMHRKMLLDDFALDVSPETPLRLISLFFGDCERYYRNIPLEKIEIPPLSFEASSYHVLITSRHENAFDERISAIELQSEGTLDLNSVAEAVVVPDAFATPDILQRLAALGITALPYDYIPRLRPESYTGALYTIVRDYYRRRGYL